MSLRDLRHASALDRESVEQAVNSLRKAGILRRLAPAEDEPRAAGRYELTGKTLHAYQAGGTWGPDHGGFAALQAAWGIGWPRDDASGYVSRVIRADPAERSTGEIAKVKGAPAGRKRQRGRTERS